MATDNVPQLPRHQQGAEPQRLLTTLFGDYWLGRSEHLPSAALVRLLAEFDTTAAGARAAIQRLAARRFLVGSRNGRETSYGVPPRSREVLNMHLGKLFGTPDQEPWDGQWTIVAFSVPEQDRAARRLLREALRSLHFGRLYDALWISPWDRTTELASLAADVQPHQLTVFRGKDLPVQPERNIAAEAFELAPVADQYRSFARDCRALLDRIRSDSPSPSEALKMRTETMTEWRRISSLDPKLPQELLGADWPGEAALAACAELYDSLGPLAESRFRSIIAGYDPALAELASHHTFRGARQLQS